jgi:hypothetical protein
VPNLPVDVNSWGRSACSELLFLVFNQKGNFIVCYLFNFH